MSINYTIAKVSARTRDNGVAGVPVALLARSIVSKTGDELLRGDSATTLAADISALITGSDLTVSGTLTTLATNVGTNTTQGATLATAIVARLTASNATTIVGLLTAANAATIAALGNIVSASTPVTTNTITARTTKANETLYIAPSGTLAALTVAFPSDANSQIGQTLTVFSTQIITALTVSSAGLTILGTALTALAATTAYRFQKVAASTWIRLQ